MRPTPEGSSMGPHDVDGDSNSFASHSSPNTFPDYGTTPTSINRSRDGTLGQDKMNSSGDHEGSMDSPRIYHDPEPNGHYCPPQSYSEYSYAAGNGQGPASTVDTPRHLSSGERPYKCEFEDCPAGVTCWTREDKLLAHNEKWHSGGPNDYTPGARYDQNTAEPVAQSSFQPASWTPSQIIPVVGYESAIPSNAAQLSPFFDQMTLKGSPNSFSYPIPQRTTMPILTHIRTKSPSSSREEFDPHYRVHKPREFRFGKVFKVLWSEPAGLDSTEITNSEVESGHREKKTFQKVRRFVIIRPMAGHCVCLPILTYGGQGVAKLGVHAEHHAIIVNEGNKPVRKKGEKEKGLVRRDIIFIPVNARHKLDGMSRLNYAKTYTVEYNVKVWFIGSVALKSEGELAANYNEVHPPLHPWDPPPSNVDYSGPVCETSGGQSSYSTGDYSGPVYETSGGQSSYSTGDYSGPVYETSGGQSSSSTGDRLYTPTVVPSLPQTPHEHVDKHTEGQNDQSEEDMYHG